MKKKLNLLVTAVLIVLIAAVIYQSFRAEVLNEKAPAGTLLQLNGSWNMEGEQADGSLLIIYHYQMPSDPTLPDALLFMQSYWTNFDVVLDNEVLYTHTKASVDGYAHLLTLGSLPYGSELEIVFHVWDTENLQQLYGSRFFVGDPNGIYNKILQENLYAFVFVLVAVILSMVVLGMSFVLRRAIVQHYQGIASLGLFILTAGIWVLTDSDLLLLITAHSAVITAVSFLSFYTMPVFLLPFTRQMMRINERTFQILWGCSLLFLAAYALNRLFSFCNTNTLLFLEHGLLVVTMVSIMFFGIREYLKSHNVKLLRVICGYAIFCASSIAALVMFYARPFSGYSQIYALGTAGFIIFLFDAACRETYEQLQRNVNLEFRARLAYTDAMTDVGNRAAFHEKQIEDQTYVGPIAYLMVDVNNLKKTNDTLGHTAGDELIIRAAQCLKAAVGGLGSCYRIGGDEFIACLRGVTEEQADNCVLAFQSLVAQSNREHDLPLSAAVGCIWSDADERDLDLLFRQADARMYEEKLRMKSSAESL